MYTQQSTTGKEKIIRETNKNKFLNTIVTFKKNNNKLFYPLPKFRLNHSLIRNHGRRNIVIHADVIVR